MPAQGSSGSCSCTSCMYKSESESPSVRRIIDEGSRIDKLYLGKYIPLREQKLLNKLIKTRTAYETARDYSDYEVVKDKGRRAKENDKTERSSAISGLVDAGAAQATRRLGECCSCCSCAALVRVGEPPRHRRRPSAVRARPSLSLRGNQSTSKSTVLSKTKKNRGSHLRGNKNVKSSPCMCPERCPELFHRPSKSRQGGAHKRKSQLGRSLQGGARKSLEKIKQSKNKMKAKAADAKKSLNRVFQSKSIYSKSHIPDIKNLSKAEMKEWECDYPCDPEECDPEECYEILMDKKEMVRMNKHHKKDGGHKRHMRHHEKPKPAALDANIQAQTSKTAVKAVDQRKVKQGNKETDMKSSKLSVSVGPKRRRKSSVAHKKNKTKDIICECKKTVKSMTDMNGEQSKSSVRTVSTGTIHGKIKKRKHVANTATLESSISNFKKSGKTVQDKKTKRHKRTESKPKLIMRDTQASIALKRCFCTLKFKPKKRKAKPEKAFQSKALTTKESESQTKISPLKPMKVTANKSTDSVSRSSSSVSKSSVNDTRKSAKAISPNKLQKKQKVHQKGQDSSASETQTQKRMLEKAVHNKEKDIKHKQSQGRVSTGRSKYTITKHGLKRCFCTLKLRKSEDDDNKNKRGKKHTEKRSVGSESSFASRSISPNKSQKKQKVHQKGQDSSASETQTQKRMLEKAVHNKEKDIKHKQSQGRVSTGISKYTITKHGLKRCFCTLKLRKSENDDNKNKRGKKNTEKRSVGSESSFASRSIGSYNAASNTPVATPRNKENVFINKKPKNMRVLKPDRATDNLDHTIIQQMKEHGSQGDYTLQEKTNVTHTKKAKKPVLGTAIKRCFCTLKLLKSGKAIKKEMTTTGTESPHFNETKDEKLMTKAVNTKDYRHKYEVEPDECEPGVCVPSPGLCDPHECLKLITIRAVSSSREYGVSTNHPRRKAEFGSTTNRGKGKTKSTSSISTAGTSSSGTITNTIKVKQQKSATRSRKPRNKHTLKESPQRNKSKPINTKTIRKARVPKEKPHNIQQPLGSKSRQVVKIGSSFSFDIQFYKDRPLYANQKPNHAKPKQPLKTTSNITESSKTYRNKGSGAEDTVTTSSQGTLHANEIKSNRGINPILKRCFCTLSLRKQHEHQIRKQNVRKTHQVYTLSSISTTRTKVTTQNRILESRDHHMIESITSGQKIKEELINSLTADYFFENFSPSKEAVNNSLMRILRGSSLPECICDSTMPYQTVSIHSKFSLDVEYVAVSKNLNMPTAQPEEMKYTNPTLRIRTQGTEISPYLKRCFCTLNTQVSQGKMIHKLKPYECEPGICVPDDCDPYECKKLIMKRLGKRSSKMSGTGTMSSTTSTTTRKGKKMQSARQGKSTKSANAVVKTAKSAVTSEDVYEREPPKGIVYRSEPNTSRRQAVRVGSSFSFDITFAKNRGNKQGFSEPQPAPVPKNHKTVSPEKRVKRKDIGTRGSTTGRSDQDTQSRALLVDKGSSVYPRLKRCFCTLKLQKRNKGAAVDLKEDQSTMTAKKRKQRVRADLTSQSTMTPPNKRKTIAMAEKNQNTKKYKGRALDPHECEPNVCIPGECDPYECLERIKTRNKKYRHRGLATETGGSRYSSSTSTARKMITGQQTKPQVTQSQIQSVGDEKKRLKKRTTHSSETPREPVKKPRTKKPAHSDVVVGGKERQVVRIGSSFSFDIQFYKDRVYPNTGDIEASARAVRSQRREKAKTHKGTNRDVSQVSRGDLSRIEKRNTDSRTQTMLGKNQGTGPGALERCFCTLKLHKPGKYPGHQNNIKVSTTRSTKARRVKNQTNPTDQERSTHHPEDISPTSYERGTQGRKFEPYECEPGVCIPGKCDPLECEKLIRQRNRKEFGTSTGIRGTRTISSTSSTTTRGRNTQHERKPHKRHGKVQSGRSKDFSVNSQEKSESGIKMPKKSSNRQAVKIGSSFSFNIDFYKERGNEDASAVHTKKKREVSRTAVSRFPKETTHKTQRTQPTRRKAKGTGASQSFSSTETQHGQTRADAESMTASFLKRCFCTLSLKKNRARGKEIKISKRGRNEQVVLPVLTGAVNPYGRLYKSHQASHSRRDIKTQYLKEKTHNRIKRKSYTDSINKIVSSKPAKMTGLSPFMKSCFFAFRAETENKSAPKGDTGSKKGAKAKGKKAPKTEQSAAVGPGKADKSKAPKTKQSAAVGPGKADKSKSPKTKQSAAVGPDTADKSKRKDEFKVIHQRNKNNHLEPGECPPGLCIPAPGKCDPYRCLEAMRGRREMRSSMAGPERHRGRERSISSMAGASPGRHTSIMAGPSGRHGYAQSPSLRYKHGGTNGGQYVVEEPRFKPIANPLRQAVRISSSFSFNVEFYKDQMSGIPSGPGLGPGQVEQQYAQRVTPSKRQQGVVCDKKICTTDKGVCQQGICLRNRGQQAYSPNTETVATGDSRLKRCFCTVKLQKLGVEMKHANVYADQRPPVTIDAMDRGVRTRDKYLEPYECEPGVCVPGKCDPYECLKRMKGKMRDAGTGMPCPFKCAETLTSGGYRDRGTRSQRRFGYRDETASARERRRERDRPPRYTQTNDEAHRPMAQGMGGMGGRQAVKYGSSFKFDIELFKDRMYPGGAGSPIYTSQRPSNVQRYRGADGVYQTPRKGTASQGQGCNDRSCRSQRTQMAGAQTESRGAGGSILKRCFCTLKFQKPYAQTKTVGYVSMPRPTNFNGFQQYSNVSKHHNNNTLHPKLCTEPCLHGNKNVIQAYRVSVDNGAFFKQNNKRSPIIKHGQDSYSRLTSNYHGKTLPSKKSPTDYSKINHKKMYRNAAPISPSKNINNTLPLTKKQDNKLTKIKMFLKNLLISSMSKPLPPKIRNAYENESEQSEYLMKNKGIRLKNIDICRANTQLMGFDLPNNIIRSRKGKSFKTSNEYNKYEVRTIYPYRPNKFHNHKIICQYDNIKSAQKHRSRKNKDIVLSHDQKIRIKTPKKLKVNNKCDSNNKSKINNKEQKKRGFWKCLKQLFVKPLNRTCNADANNIEIKHKFTANTPKRKLNSSQSERYQIASKFTSNPKKSKSVKLYGDAKKQRKYVMREKYENQIFCRYQYGDADQCMIKSKRNYVSQSQKSYGSEDFPNSKHDFRNQGISKSRFSAYADQKIVQFAMISPKRECKPEQCTKSGERCVCNVAKMITGKVNQGPQGQLPKLLTGQGNKQKKGNADANANVHTDPKLNDPALSGQGNKQKKGNANANGHSNPKPNDPALSGQGNKQKKGKNNVDPKSKEPTVSNKQGKKGDRICKTPKPCACCLKNKKGAKGSEGKDPKNAVGGECIKECATKPLKPPPPPKKTDNRVDCGKPLFEMKMEAESMAIMNREQIFEKVNKLKKQKEMSAEMLAKLHGKNCQCCFCKKFSGTAKMAARLAVMGDKSKKLFGPKPCVCGSQKCEAELMKERMHKLEQKQKKKKEKSCVCGSKICGDEAIKMAVKKKLITKEKGANIKKKRKNATQEKLKKKQRKQKDKKNALDLAARQKRYKKEDALRHMKMLKQDKEALKQVKKYKNSGTLVLCAESVIDVFKLAVTTVVTFLRCTIRSILDPRVTWRKLRDAKDDPTRLMRTVSGAWADSGISSTARRVGLRMRHMPLVNRVVDKLESNAATSFALHSCDKDPKSRMKAMAKLKNKKRYNKRQALDFECSLYMASLRKRPHMWVYYKCPWFYPHCVSILHILRQFIDIGLFLLAVLVWSPCIIAMEICRTSMCCTACTG